ncbi:hypothetical protein [Cellulomonas sp. SG140]|uniref:hypothetical protein n=1 Tax=Cellulomonas sp. SG140 TaxID=2976536 RepID=UPI0021E78684|nr:hypothetical protein [Cellulomonas sp. SG140]
MSRILHVGVNITKLRDFLRDSEVDWEMDGDGWEVWGERVGDDANDTLTLHLTTEVDSTADAVALIASAERARLLTPMVGGGALGALAVLTDPSDWSEDVLTLHTTRAIEVRLQRAPSFG